MVTSQELEEALKANQSILNKPLPVRRFGSGTNPIRVQAQELAQKNVAAQNVADIQKQQQSNAQYDSAVAQQQAQQAFLTRFSVILGKSKSGLDRSVYRRQVREGASNAGFSQEQVQKFLKDYDRNENNIKQYEADVKARNKQIEQGKAQGLEPQFDKAGKLTGYADYNKGQSIPLPNITKVASSSQADRDRYLRAGLVQLAPSKPTAYEEQQKMSLIESERYKSPENIKMNDRSLSSGTSNRSNTSVQRTLPTFNNVFPYNAIITKAKEARGKAESARTIFQESEVGKFSIQLKEVFKEGFKDIGRGFLGSYLEAAQAQDIGLQYNIARNESIAKSIKNSNNLISSPGQKIAAGTASAFIAAEFTPLAPLVDVYLIGNAAKGGYELYNLETAPMSIEKTTLRNERVKFTVEALSLIPTVLKVKNEIPYYTSSFNSAIEKDISLLPDPNVLYRNRATELVEVINKQGESLGYILGKNKQGEFISLGGKPEKGESISQAALREAFEEVKLKEKDIISREYLGRQGNSEEVQNIFLSKISEETFNNLKPASDITELGLFKAEDFLKIKGSTSSAPRYVLEGNTAKILLFGENAARKVRIDEAELLGRLDVFKKAKNMDLEDIKDITLITKLKAKGYKDRDIIVESLLKKEGRLPTGTFIRTDKGLIDIRIQSRYDVAPSKQFLSLSEKFLKKQYSLEEFKFRSSKLNLNYFEEATIDKLISIRSLGYKEYSKPQLLVSGTFNDLILNNNKQLEIIPSLSKRGGAGFYFQPPVKPSGRGYLGLSYVLGGSEKDFSFSLFPKSSTRKILYGKFQLDTKMFELATKLKENGYSYKQVQKIINKESAFGKIGATAKTAYGIEVEVATNNAIFELSKGKTVTKLEGQRIILQPLTKVTNKVKAERLSSLYESLNKETNYLNKIFIKSEIKDLSNVDLNSLGANEKNIAASRLYNRVKNSITSKGKEEISIKEEGIYLKSKENSYNLRPESIRIKEIDKAPRYHENKRVKDNIITPYMPPREVFTNKPYTEIFKPQIYREPPRPPPREPLRLPPPTPPREPPRRRTNDRNIFKNSSQGSLSVQLRRFGKFNTLGSRLNPQQASALAFKAANNTLGRTVRFAGATEQLRKLNINRSFYRQPKSRSSLNAPFTFIEQSKYALSTRGELGAIQAARGRR